jgi:hypothetical protein
MSKKNTNLFVPIPHFNFPLLKCASYYNRVKERLFMCQCIDFCINEHIGFES